MRRRISCGASVSISWIHWSRSAMAKAEACRSEVAEIPMPILKSKSKLAAVTAGGMCCLLFVATVTAAGASKPEPSRAEIEQKLQEAQKRLDTAAREVADLSMSLSDDV